MFFKKTKKTLLKTVDNKPTLRAVIYKEQ